MTHRGIAFRHGSDGERPSRLEIGFQTIQSYPYLAGLATPLPTCLRPIIALTACCCPLGLSTPGQLLTQKHSSLFLLAQPGIPSCATRRTVSPFRRSRFCAYETCSLFTC